MAKLKPEKAWKTRITRAKTQNTRPNVELDTCSNSTVWNSMKLELDIMWARSSTNFSYQIHTYKCIFLHQCINQIGRSRFCNLLYGRKWNRDPATVITNNFSSRLLPRVLHKGYVKKRPLRQVYHKSLAK